MGIDPPKVPALLNGRLASFSTERLMRLLAALGEDVEVVVRERPSSLEKGRIQVVGEAFASGPSTFERASLGGLAPEQEL